MTGEAVFKGLRFLMGSLHCGSLLELANPVQLFFLQGSRFVHCGLSLYQGNKESRKNLEQSVNFQVGTESI